MRRAAAAALLAAAAALPGAAAADACGPERTFLSCRVEDGRALAVRFDGCHARYAFGDFAAPELALERPLGEVGFAPWPGVGRSIWEEATFANGDVRYAVHGGYDRMAAAGPGGDAAAFGGVEVRRGEAVLARLDCAAGTVAFDAGGGLFEAKSAAGERFDRETRSWVPAR